jgi:diguanylate cyclase (GGDEF)-like protein
MSLRQLEEFARRSHALACNFNALLASYLRGDNCLIVGARALAALQQRRGYTDELTQLHNQHWLETMLPRLLERSQFDSAPLSLVMLAIDKFERIEREFGSVAGEQILAAVGQLLLEVARTTDLLVCDGNRRFVAILPNTSLDGARIFCRRLHEEIRSLRVGAPDERPLPSLTFSSGIVQRCSEQPAADLLGGLESLVKKSVDGGGDALSE